MDSVLEYLEKHWEIEMSFKSFFYQKNYFTILTKL